MASIHGLPPSGAALPQRTGKVSKKQRITPSEPKTAVGQATKVANAVAHTIRHVSEGELHRAQVHYDLPEGRARKAMEEYMEVMNQAKKEELKQLLGVDIYI